MPESQSLQALRRLGQKAVQERDRARSDLKNEVAVLQEAGVAAARLALILGERGLGRDELEELGLAALIDDPDPEPLIINTHCIKTCVKATIEITIKVGCKNSVGG